MNMYLDIKPCPVCGKMPDIIRDYSYESAGFGSWVIIQCKMFLRKPHIKVESGKASFNRAFHEAVQMWNAECLEIIEK
jgi:hypothetical protein